MDLTRILLDLEQSQLIWNDAASQTVAFKHALIQDSAYQSLTRSERRRLHGIVGRTLELLFADRAADLADTLAKHFDEAGDKHHALTLYTRAAEMAAARSANPEAAMLYGRAFQLALEIDATDEQLVHLGNRRGRSFELAGHQVGALQHYSEMIAEGRRRGSWRLEMEGLAASASLHAVPTEVFDVPEAMRKGELALRLAREHSDRAAQSKILWTQMRAAMEEPIRSLALGEESLAIARSLDLKEQIAFTLNDLQAIYIMLGRFDKASQAVEEARDLWTTLNNLPMLTDSLISLATQKIMGGDFSTALRLAREGLALSEKIGNLWGQAFARMPIALIQFSRWTLGPLVETLETCLDQAEQAGFIDPLVTMRSLLAVVMGLLGDTQAGMDHVEQAFRLAEKNTAWMTSAYAARAVLWVTRGDLAQARADLDALDSVGADPLSLTLESSFMAPLARLEVSLSAEDYDGGLAFVDQVISWSEKLGVRALTGRLLTYRGILLSRLARVEEARRALEEALEITRAQALDAAAWQPLAALATLEAGQGNLDLALRLRRESGDWLETIANGISDPRLRSSFRSTPAYRDVMEGVGNS
ncbi:MAG TPA: hypothetical protein VFI11_00460 [Anaerolineales bacterium]|nr:hypothetical protein [Anaerolineales bacterium]